MILLIGYGNPGRGDDGLGPALATRIASRELPGVTVVIDYQLTVEHALQVSTASEVLFADARIGGTVPFDLSSLAAPSRGEVSSHALSPETVLALANLLYGATPPASLLGISGEEFGEIREGLSPTAERNLDRAETFLLDWLAAPSRGYGEPHPLVPHARPSK